MLFTLTSSWAGLAGRRQAVAADSTVGGRGGVRHTQRPTR